MCNSAQDLCAARSEVFRKVRDTDLPRLMQANKRDRERGRAPILGQLLGPIHLLKNTCYSSCWSWKNLLLLEVGGT